MQNFEDTNHQETLNYQENKTELYKNSDTQFNLAFGV